MSPPERACPFRGGTAQPLTLEVIWYAGTIIDEMTVPATSRYTTRPKVEDRAAARPRPRAGLHISHTRYASDETPTRAVYAIGIEARRAKTRDQRG
ncbi:hypothetical protein [Asticcacaulis excentricus]|uniref:Uncharacterized protein n=1 Tax=Asticcacaulis excentricus (strain ATCC 15261 / DSM 4724 / KCTC 12464 / NCIMB 9791 / VKM B-1370 / CB 48) TaxID=573065 RepID=E8RVU1_ASTEC|nr:hypothetical protein [Asticcacaulis excentricus]ADU15363.1 hypothetical protein Astex_3752 [Asticcacaulis excentricus CB 48]